MLELKIYLAHGFKVFLIEALVHLSLTRLVYRSLQSNCTFHKRWEARQNPNLVGEKLGNACIIASVTPGSC